MGWWSCDVMGGDTPMDIEVGIRGAIEASGHALGDDEPTSVSNLQTLMAVLSSSKQSLDNPFPNSESVSDYIQEKDWIFWQVLAVLVMRGGGPLSVVKEQVIEAIKRDAWAQNDRDRAQAMQVLRQAVESYTDGQPMQVESKSLLDAVEDHLEQGHSGLINKVRPFRG